MSETPDKRPGIKSTEFLITVVTVVGGPIAAALASNSTLATIFAGAAGLCAAVYIWGRTILKKELAKETNVIPDSWEPTVDTLLNLTEALANALPVSESPKDPDPDEPT